MLESLKTQTHTKKKTPLCKGYIDLVVKATCEINVSLKSSEMNIY